MILVEPQDEGDPHRSLLILTRLMQDEYGMSRKEVREGYPHITVKDTVKEIWSLRKDEGMVNLNLFS